MKKKIDNNNNNYRNVNYNYYYRHPARISLLLFLLTLTVSMIVFSSFSSSLSSPMIFSSANAFHLAKDYVFVKKWGSLCVLKKTLQGCNMNAPGAKEVGDGQFQRVHDLDFDPQEKYLYTLDRDNNRVQVFDKNGTFIMKWGSKGAGDGQFFNPYGVDIDSAGNVWVVERNGERVQKFDKDGNFLFKFGSLGAGEGQFNFPRMIAVDKDLKYMYVVDSNNNRIQKFDINGNFLMSWGGNGTGDGQFNVPVSVVIDNNNDIIVDERGNSRVQKFDSNGKFLLKFGSEGPGDGQFSHIEHIAVDKYNNIYVNDPQSDKTGNHIPRVQKFSPDGKFITKFGSGNGTGDGQLIDPEHLAIDSNGYVYVSDRGNNNIQVFKPVDDIHIL
jgi:DNA-binding beta-propeller fold protein YncE